MRGAFQSHLVQFVPIPMQMMAAFFVLLEALFAIAKGAQCDSGGFIQIHHKNLEMVVNGSNPLQPAPPPDPFACPTDTVTTLPCSSSGWELPVQRFNDSFCDCPECEDEADHTCAECACPVNCTDITAPCPGTLPDSVSELDPECEKAGTFEGLFFFDAARSWRLLWDGL